MFYEDNGGQALLGEVLDMKAEREGYHIPYRIKTGVVSIDCLEVSFIYKL
jgi:hypothetical protein